MQGFVILAALGLGGYYLYRKAKRGLMSFKDELERMQQSQKASPEQGQKEIKGARLKKDPETGRYKPVDDHKE